LKEDIEDKRASRNDKRASRSRARSTAESVFVGLPVATGIKTITDAHERMLSWYEG